MSVASEISRIQTNIADSLDAVTSKGVAVPSGANSDDLAPLINQIKTLSWQDFGTDDTTQVISYDHLPQELNPYKTVNSNQIYYFTEKIHDPLIPGESGESIFYAEIDSGWCVMFPSTYSPTGKASPVVALLHGGGGHCSSGFMGYATSGSTTATGWTNIKTALLNAGYVIFDINGYGTYASVENTDAHYGNPGAVETMKKAFEHLKRDYNVEHKLSIVGVSMAGALIMSYTMNYPSDVIACVGLAPLILQYSASHAATSIASGENLSSRDKLAVAYGYVDYNEMWEDNMSNLCGYSPVMAATRYTDNGAYIPQMDWSKFTYRTIKPTDTSSSDYAHVCESIDYCKGFNFAFHFPVPYRIWHGDADTTVGIGAGRWMINMLRKGGSNASLRVCPNLTHADLHGSTGYVVTEFIDWLKRIR